MASGMHVFISRALQKILREAPKKHAQLRQACIEVIGTLLAAVALPSLWLGVGWLQRLAPGDASQHARRPTARRRVALAPKLPAAVRAQRS